MGEWDDGLPGNGARGGKPEGDLWPSPVKLLCDDVGVSHLSSFLLVELVAKSNELRSMDEWKPEPSENIFDPDFTPGIMSRPKLPWLA